MLGLKLKRDPCLYDIIVQGLWILETSGFMENGYLPCLRIPFWHRINDVFQHDTDTEISRFISLIDMGPVGIFSTGRMNCVVLNVVMNNQVCLMLSRYPLVSIDIFKPKRKLKLLCYTDSCLILQNENNKLIYNFSLCSGYIVFFKDKLWVKKPVSRTCRSLIYLHMSPS